MSETILNQILSELKNVNLRLDAIETDTKNLKTDVAVLKDDVAVLKGDVTVLKGDVAVLKDDVAVLKDDVAVLKTDNILLKQAVLETNETVKRIEIVQEQQHRIIELLSARSIEQEATIKRIK
jgi:chromosome segregation ATPase